MVKTKDHHPDQLWLDLTGKSVDAGAAEFLEVPEDGPAEPPTIVCFVDARTLAVRRDAINRVARSGIFSLPHGKSA